MIILLTGYQFAAAQNRTTRHRNVKLRFPTPIIFEFDPYPLPLDSVGKHIFDEVIITDTVYSVRANKRYTLLEFGARYPNQSLTVVVKNQVAHHLSKPLKGKIISVTGKLLIEDDRNDGRPIIYVDFVDFIKEVDVKPVYLNPKL